MVVQRKRICFGCDKTRVQCPALARVFMFIFCFVVVFLLFVQKHIICHNNLVIPSAMVMFLEHIRYCKICDRL